MVAQLEADPVDTRVVKALGHPTRVRILNVLRDRELASPVELSNELGVALGTVGYHVRRLEALGFIELARRTQRRGAVEHHYRARQLLDEVGAGSEGAAHRAASTSASVYTGRGAEALAIAQAAQMALGRGGFDALAAHVDRRVLALDEPGQAELADAMARWQSTLERIVGESAARVAEVGEPPAHRCAAVLMCFDLPAALDES